jgi:hypothetical protein
MLCFNTYNLADNHEDLKDFIFLFRKHGLENLHAGLRTINQYNHLLTEERFILALSRFIHINKLSKPYTETIANYINWYKFVPKIYSIQEMLINEEVTSLLNIDKLEVCRLYLSTINPRKKSESEYEIDNPSIATYFPKHSGFFSILENLCAAKYVAKRINRNLVIGNRYEGNSTRSNWWPYAIPFDNIFPDLIKQDRQSIHKREDVLDFDKVRSYIISAPPKVLQDYSNFKAGFYRRIKTLLESYIGHQEATTDEPKTYYYLRMGDKIHLETISLSLELTAEELTNASTDCSNVHVLSDSYDSARELTLKNRKFINATSSKFKGHYLAQSNTEEDVLAIIGNFLALANSKLNISCPSSNLVNAASWANYSAKHYKSRISAVPRYILF